ncbi:MAG TPA: Ig-like domain-containing protein, partial [Chthoniobacterales bacterium]|nr:Ig-like domain-containing protein [Chthoniobacterales bacterium]
SRIFVGGYTELRYTLNGGTTWLTAGGLHPDMHAIAVAPMQPPAPQTYYLGGDGGIHRADYPNSNPPSITFISKNQNLPGILTQGVSISRDDRVLIGTQDNSNQIYRPASPPWAPVFNQFLSGDGERPFIEFENNTEKMYVLALMPGFPNPRVVANIGAPCRIINNSPSSVTPPGAINEFTILYSAMSVQFKIATNSDRVIMGFQNVWRSVDSGNNWTRIGGTACPGPSPSATPNHNCGIASNRVITSVCEAPSDSNYIYAVADYGKQIFMTANANAGTGATWQDITRNLAANMSPDDISRVVVHPTDPLTAYLAGSHYVHKTSDGGATNWVNEAVGPDFVFRDVIFHPADPSQVLVASHRGIYHRVNGTWTSLSWALPEGMAWWGLSFNHYSHQLAAAGYGRGVYTIDLDRVAPTATVNSPTSGAHVRGTITVLGTAGDNHLVASAQLKLDGGNFPPGGGDTPDPNVSVNWNTTQSLNGSHVLTLVVYDPYGNHTTSAGVTVTVDNLAPTVSITDPEDGKEVSGKMSVSATASDNVGVAGVQFYLDGDSLGSEVTSEPFSTDWDTTSTKGEHTLVAIARDEAGNTTTSNNVTVKVKN